MIVSNKEHKEALEELRKVEPKEFCLADKIFKEAGETYLHTTWVKTAVKKLEKLYIKKGHLDWSDIVDTFGEKLI